MAKPPPTGPHSDIEGVNRDARAGMPSGDPRPDPGKAIGDAKSKGKARPEEGAPAAAGDNGDTPG